MGKMINLTGKRFGRLLVLNDTGRRLGSAVVWRCKCDCGRIVEIPARYILHGGVVSCGCLRREKSVQNLSGDIADKLGQIEHTNVSRIKSSTPQANNHSGFRGVSWHKFSHGKGGKWRAVIYFKGTRYSLGLFDAPDKASAAYLEAKNHIHGDFVKWYNSTYKR